MIRERDRRMVVIEDWKDTLETRGIPNGAGTKQLVFRRTHCFQRCHVHVYPGFVETVFHDGTRVTALPEHSKAYKRRAAELGYGKDVAALCREHQILHTWLAEAHGLSCSPTLWTRAHGGSLRAWREQEGEGAEDGCGCIPPWAQEAEEQYIYLFQSYLNGNEAAAEELPGPVKLWRPRCLRLLRDLE